MRRLANYIIPCVIIVLGLFVFGLYGDNHVLASSKKLKIVAVFQVPNIDFFIPTHIGALDAAEEYGVELEWLGPSDMSAQGTISILETVLAKGIDGLVLESLDPKTLGPLADQARRMGIPVILTNDINEAKGYDAFCGADSIAIGTLMGQLVENAMLGKGPWAQKTGYNKGKVVGKIAYASDAPGSPMMEKRVVGVKKYLSKFQGIKDIGTYDSTLSVEKGQEVINNILTANPDIAAIVAVGSGPSVAAGMAIKERGLQGKTVVVGMDILPHTLRLVEEGIIAAVIGQNQYNQGYLPVKALCEYLINKRPIPKFMPTALEVVDLSNVKKIKKRELDFLAKGKK